MGDPTIEVEMVAVHTMERFTLDGRSSAEPHAETRLWTIPDWQHESVGSGLQLCVLGSPHLRLDGLPVVLRTRKTLALVTYLAIQRGPQPREHLADLLWPEADMGDARASLRTALSYLRQALGNEVENYMSTTRESVGLRTSARLNLDAWALAEAQRALRKASDSCNLRGHIEQALAVSQGTFLADISLPDAPDFEAWLEGQRAYWRAVEEELLDRLATLQIQDGDVAAAVSTLEHWTQVNPDEEVAWHRLIDQHLRHGDSPGARRAWKQYREVLTELDAEPNPEIVALVDRISGASGLVDLRAGSPHSGCAKADGSTPPPADLSREWFALLDAFERVRSGGPEVVILKGADGTQKNELLSQVALSLKQTGADVLLGRALDTEDELPYGAVVEALRGRLEEENAPDDLLSDLWLAELARLLPELAERYPDLPAPANDPLLISSRIFEAVARLGQALAERKALLVCLDDAQWTDRATRDLVRYAVRRWMACRAPVLLVVAMESGDAEVDWKLTPWLHGLERDAPTQCLTLDAHCATNPGESVDRGIDHPYRFDVGVSPIQVTARTPLVNDATSPTVNKVLGHSMSGKAFVGLKSAALVNQV